MDNLKHILANRLSQMSRHIHEENIGLKKGAYYAKIILQSSMNSNFPEDTICVFINRNLDICAAFPNPINPTCTHKVILNNNFDEDNYNEKEQEEYNINGFREKYLNDEETSQLITILENIQKGNDIENNNKLFEDKFQDRIYEIMSFDEIIFSSTRKESDKNFIRKINKLKIDPAFANMLSKPREYIDQENLVKNASTIINEKMNEIENIRNEDYNKWEIDEKLQTLFKDNPKTHSITKKAAKRWKDRTFSTVIENTTREIYEILRTAELNKEKEIVALPPNPMYKQLSIHVPEDYTILDETKYKHLLQTFNQFFQIGLSNMRFVGVDTINQKNLFETARNTIKNQSKCYCLSKSNKAVIQRSSTNDNIDKNKPWIKIIMPTGLSDIYQNTDENPTKISDDVSTTDYKNAFLTAMQLGFEKEQIVIIAETDKLKLFNDAKKLAYEEYCKNVGAVNPPAPPAVKPPAPTAVKPPEQTAVKPPEQTAVKPPEQTAVKPPEQTAVKPPEQTAVKPPEQTAVKPSEQTAVKPPANSNNDQINYSFMMSCTTSHSKVLTIIAAAILISGGITAALIGFGVIPVSNLADTTNTAITILGVAVASVTSAVGLYGLYSLSPKKLITLNPNEDAEKGNNNNNNNKK